MPKATILVAEDEPFVREMCLRSLWLAGYEATGVSNGQDAVARMQQEPFDALVTDLRMPQMSGLDVCRAIRELNPELPIVVITGYGTMESAIEAIKLGVSEFLLKPFSPDDLKVTVERALLKQRLERENARLNALIPLYDLSRLFMSSTDLATIPQRVVAIARQEMGADRASLMLAEGENTLVLRAAEGLPEQALAERRQPADQGIAGYVFTHRKPVVLQGDRASDPRFEPGPADGSIASAISLPLIHQDRVLGVLNVAKTQESPPFTEADVELLSVLASQAAVAIENARLFAEIEDAYRRVSELDHLKSEFIGIAAHELRAPLAILLAYATIIEDEATGPMREHLTQVVDSAMQLKSIIDEMVSLRRIDTGTAQVERTPIALAPIAGNVLQELDSLVRQKELDLTVSLPDDLPTVMADEQVLALILSNLLSNAVKFTPTRGAVSLAASVEAEGEMIIRVTDTGIGIPAEERDRIFDRFYQVESSLRREHGGIGLGLAIAREMTELIDGRLWVESQVGQGSTFYLALPV